MAETELKAPKAIIFDWDNTLVDTWPLIHSAMHETFSTFGLTPWTLEEVKAKVGHSLRDAFPPLFGDNWEAAGKHYQQAYLRDHLEKLEVLPLSEEVLRFLKEKGVYLAIVSNKKGESLRSEVKHLGWDKYFDKLVGYADAARDKPHRDPVDMALEGSGLECGEEVWFVGDSPIDLECAHNTGCVPVLYGEAIAEMSEDGRLHYRGFDVHLHTPTHDDFLAVLKRMLA